MDTAEAGRKGGQSRSAAKVAASRKNIACAICARARKKTETAVPQDSLPQIEPEKQPPLAVLFVGKN